MVVECAHDGQRTVFSCDRWLKAAGTAKPRVELAAAGAPPPMSRYTIDVKVSGHSSARLAGQVAPVLLLELLGPAPGQAVNASGAAVATAAPGVASSGTLRLTGAGTFAPGGLDRFFATAPALPGGLSLARLSVEVAPPAAAPSAPAAAGQAAMGPFPGQGAAQHGHTGAAPSPTGYVNSVLAHPGLALGAQGAPGAPAHPAAVLVEHVLVTAQLPDGSLTSAFFKCDAWLDGSAPRELPAVAKPTTAPYTIKVCDLDSCPISLHLVSQPKLQSIMCKHPASSIGGRRGHYHRL